MRAALLTTFGEPLELREAPRPRPADDEVLVRVRAVGLCGSDLKLLAGATPGTPLPLIPGHEIAGEVAEPAGDLRVGQRVAGYLYEPCGHCASCARGEDMLCPRARRIGRDRDGGLAEYVAIRRRALLPFGEELPFELAAVAMDAVTTPWHALRARASLRPGERLLVVGAGGIGIHAVAVAADLGARVLAVDPVARRRRAARRCGAEASASPADRRALREWAPDGVDAALEASGTRAGFELAVASVRPGGRVACCGYHPAVELSVASAHLVMRELTVLGCRAGTSADAAAALDAVQAGRIHPVVDRRLPLARANDAIGLLGAGEAVGRIVVEP